MSQPLVLVADPTTLTTELSRALSARNVSIDARLDGVGAIDSALRQRPPIVILTAVLPDSHAFEICQAIKRFAASYRPRVIVLADTPAEATFHRRSWSDFGVDLCFVRPIPTKVVARAVDELLAWMERHDPVQLPSPPELALAAA